MKKIILDRAQMGRRFRVPNPIDTTVKSSSKIWKSLAPTWNMVMSHKAHTMSDAKYTEQYAVILDNADWESMLIELQEHEEVTFVCYCHDGVFCHTHLIIDYMMRMFPQLFEDGRNVALIPSK